MLCEGILMYALLVKVFSSKFARKWWSYFILGWGKLDYMYYIVALYTPCMWPNLWKAVLYAHLILWLWRSITSFISELLSQCFLVLYKCNDRNALIPNFKQTQAELLYVKLKACISLFFANSVTYTPTYRLLIYSIYKADNLSCFLPSYFLKQIGKAISHAKTPSV